MCKKGFPQEGVWFWEALDTTEKEFCLEFHTLGEKRGIKKYRYCAYSFVQLLSWLPDVIGKGSNAKELWLMSQGNGWRVNYKHINEHHGLEGILGDWSPSIVDAVAMMLMELADQKIINPKELK